ncbi:MAG: tRNA lysidine(34) synthetase TilS [Planctomycetes bacterium]|nr:tRNA lysidine(34) synthetase TilS [Planctomycetota bacterium]
MSGKQFHDEFVSRLAQAWPPAVWHDVTLLVAVSGGADSVAMLRALADIAPEAHSRLVVGHFHHGLRGIDADRDRDFVAELAAKLGLPCELGEGATAQKAASDGDGIEAAARAMRYDWLLATAHRVGARYVCTAHAAEDQAETVLHRVLRGTGLVGLRGIKRARELGDGVALYRPLLAFRRGELRDYLARQGQAFREDGSNSDRGLTRNRLRLDVMPALAEQFNPQLIEALVRLGMLAGEAQSVVEGQVSLLHERAVRRENPLAVRIDVRALAGVAPYLVRELLAAVWHEQRWPLQAMGHAEWTKLSELAQGAEISARQMFPGRIMAERAGDALRLYPVNAASAC